MSMKKNLGYDERVKRAFLSYHPCAGKIMIRQNLVIESQITTEMRAAGGKNPDECIIFLLNISTETEQAIFLLDNPALSAVLIF